MTEAQYRLYHNPWKSLLRNWIGLSFLCHTRSIAELMAGVWPNVEVDIFFSPCINLWNKLWKISVVIDRSSIAFVELTHKWVNEFLKRLRLMFCHTWCSFMLQLTWKLSYSFASRPAVWYLWITRWWRQMFNYGTFRL